MQPCSQPRYGLTLASNPTSGLSLVLMIESEWSLKNCVWGAGSSGSFQSGLRSREIISKRFGGFSAAPRVRGVGALSCIFARPDAEESLIPGRQSMPCQCRLSQRIFNKAYEAYHPQLPEFAAAAIRILCGKGTVLNRWPTELHSVRRNGRAETWRGSAPGAISISPWPP